MVPFKIFVVEDDDYYSELLTYQLSLNPDYEVVRFATGRDFLQNLHQRPSAITLDYSLPDMACEEVIAKVKAYNADLPIVIVSGQEDVSTAVSLLKEGIYDYIVKDTDTKDRVWNCMKNVRDHLALKSELSTLREEIGTKYDFCSSIKGRSNCMQRVFNLVSKAAKTNIAVSVLGETGTG
ncbi:MAG: response regulator, partial [Bacteroidota bacterium]